MKYEKQIVRFERLFQILFLLYAIVGFNSITNGTILVSVFMWPTFLLGAALLCVRLWNWKHYIHTPGIFCLLAMCAICACSILVNHQYDLKKNVIYLFFWVVYFFLYYTQSDTEEGRGVQKQFRIMGHIVSASSLILAVTSITMLFTGYSEILEINGAEIIRGFTYGILYGAYLTPNGGAILATLTILLSVYFIKYYRKPLYTVYAVVNICVQFMFIVFSDSRSGMVALAVGSATYVLITLLLQDKFGKGFGRGAVITLLVVVTGLGVLAAPRCVQKVYNKSVQVVVEYMEEHGLSAQSGDEEEDGKTKDELVDSFKIDRGYEMSGDVSNRRFDVWKSGFEIFAEKPLLGTTFTGFLPYAIENLPHTYIVDNDYMQLTTLDNDFMNLLVSNGIFAILAFLVFIVLILIYLFRNLMTQKSTDKSIPMLMAVCAGVASSSMFASGILYMQSPYSIMFWMALGILTILASKAKKEKNHGKCNANSTD